MAKSKSAKNKEIEFEPDAWLRFERFIRDIAKAGPQHRSAAKTAPAQPKKQQTRTKKDI